MWEDLRGLSLQLLESILKFTLLKRFRIGEEGIVEGVVASRLFIQQICHQDRSRLDLSASINLFFTCSSFTFN